MKLRIELPKLELPDGAEIRGLIEEVRQLYEEVAYYLDDDQVERFPGYFVDDCMYQVVSRENYAEHLPQAAIFCDGLDMVHDRVTALRETQVFVPRTWRHQISAVRITRVEADAIHASANFIVTECMSNVEPAIHLVGQYISSLVRRDGRLKFKQHLAVYDNYRVMRSLIVPV